jgi:hypothetical protein
VILAHGEDRARQTLGGIIQERYRLKPEYPAMGGAIEA